MQPQQPAITKYQPPIEGSTSVQLATCATYGFRPAESFALQWKFGDQQQQSPSNLTLQKTPEETFNYTSQYQATVNRTDNGKTLICTVSHRTLTAQLFTEETITVQCKSKYFKK